MLLVGQGLISRSSPERAGFFLYKLNRLCRPSGGWNASVDLTHGRGSSMGEQSRSAHCVLYVAVMYELP